MEVDRCIGLDRCIELQAKGCILGYLIDDFKLVLIGILTYKGLNKLEQILLIASSAALMNGAPKREQDLWPAVLSGISRWNWSCLWLECPA